MEHLYNTEKLFTKKQKPVKLMCAALSTYLKAENVKGLNLAKKFQFN